MSFGNKINVAAPLSMPRTACYGTTVEGLPVPDGSEASSGGSHHNADILKVIEPLLAPQFME
jgi:hypothetical protein